MSNSNQESPKFWAPIKFSDQVTKWHQYADRPLLTPNCDANKTCLLLIVPCPQESNKKTEANELSMDSVGGVFVVLIGEKDAGFLADDTLVVIVDDCDGDWELQF